MLKLRVVTALFLIIFSLSAIIFCSTPIFAVISALFFLAALWEWTSLAGFDSTLNRIGGFLAVLLTALLILISFRFLNQNLLKTVVPKIFIIFWVIAFMIVVRYPKDTAWLKSKKVGVLVGAMMLVPAWGMLVALQYFSINLLLYVIALVAISDTAAYFVGKRFGQRRLASAISPGKTWEGVAGALVFALLLALGGYKLLEPSLSITYWLALSFMAVVFSIVGDLFESVFKRMRNLKDSGSLLPGHGGILDRIDGLVAAIPVFAVGLM